MFAAYASGKGHALIDRQLYLPRTWTDDRVRRPGAHVPEDVAFATKPHLALAMIGRAMVANVPFAWVAADSVYGVGDIEKALRRAGKGYVLGVSSAHHFNSWIGKPEVGGTAGTIGDALDPTVWPLVLAGRGTKGEGLYEWAYCELADLEADEYAADLSGLWTRGISIRRSLTDGERACFTTGCPAGTPVRTLVGVEGRRWAIEDAKTELGLAHNETRSWHGWHRHVSPVMLDFAMRAAVRHRANDLPPPERTRRTRHAAS